MRHASHWALARLYSSVVAYLALQVTVPVVQADVADWPGGEGAPGPRPNLRVQSNGTACPTEEQLQMALRQAGVFAAITNPGWRLAYGAVSSGTGSPRVSSIWIELTSPTRELITRRELPNDGGDCGAITGAIVAIVEHSLHRLGWTRGEPLPGRARLTVRDSMAVPGIPPPLPKLVVGMGPALGTSSRMGVNIAMEARVHLVGSFSLRLGGGLLAKEDRWTLGDTVGNPQARSNSRQVSATLLSTLPLPRNRASLDVGAAFQVSIDRGRTQDLSSPAEGYRAALAAGLLVGGNIRLSPRWRFALDLQGLRAVPGADFVVAIDGTRQVVLPPPPWQGIVCAKLEFIAWP